MHGKSFSKILGLLVLLTSKVLFAAELPDARLWNGNYKLVDGSPKCAMTLGVTVDVGVTTRGKGCEDGIWSQIEIGNAEFDSVNCGISRNGEGMLPDTATEITLEKYQGGSERIVRKMGGLSLGIFPLWNSETTLEVTTNGQLTWVGHSVCIYKKG